VIRDILLTLPGLRSTEALRAGQYVDTYFGEVIKVEEALRRVEEAEKGKNKNSYLFQLDKFEEDVTPKYEIDGEYVGGPTRFISLVNPSFDGIDSVPQSVHYTQRSFRQFLLPHRQTIGSSFGSF